MWENAKSDLDEKKKDSKRITLSGDRLDNKKRHYVHDLSGISLKILLREITAEEQGDEAFQEKEYAEAIHHFSIAIEESETFSPVPSECASKVDSGSAELYFKRALVYEKTRDWGRAVQDAEKVCPPYFILSWF
jgi:hypothetical protein